MARRAKLEYGAPIGCPKCGKPGTVQDVESDHYNVIHDRAWRDVKSASTGLPIKCETSRCCRVEKVKA